MKWRAVGVPSGALAWVITAAATVFGLGWALWPVWSSHNAPSSAEQNSLAPWLLAALSGLLALLAWQLWLGAGRTLGPFAPIIGGVALSTFLRIAANPQSSGVEFVYLGPLLVGMVLGGPAGFLTGALAAIISSVMVGSVSGILVTQLIVWGLWGLAGGILTRLPDLTAWLVGVLACLPLGLLSGMLLNAPGWPSAEDNGTFTRGDGPLQSASALLDYSLQTSLAWDLSRGVSSGLMLLLVGLPVLRAARTVWQPEMVDDPNPTPPATLVDHQALSRRTRARQIGQLWTGSNTPQPAIDDNSVEGDRR